MPANELETTITLLMVEVGKSLHGLTYGRRVLKAWMDDQDLGRRINTGQVGGWARQLGSPIPPDNPRIESAPVILRGIDYENRSITATVGVRPRGLRENILEWAKRDLVVLSPVCSGSVDEDGIVGARACLVRVDLVLVVGTEWGSIEADLPEFYVPSEMRPKPPEPNKPPRYSVGLDHTGDMSSFGMTDGPFEKLEEALEIVPEWGLDDDKRAFLFRLYGNGQNEILYEWKKSGWRRYKEAESRG